MGTTLIILGVGIFIGIGIGFKIGEYDERKAWNGLIEKGIIPRPDIKK